MNSGWVTAGLIGAAVVVAAGLMLLAVVLIRQRSRQRTVPVRRARPAADAPGPAAAEATRTAERLAPVRLVDPDGQVLTVGSLPATLGRAADNAVVLADPSVSARHARLYRDPALGTCIEDLDSLNGLQVDGRLTRRNVLRDGATITLGAVALVFHER